MKRSRFTFGLLIGLALLPRLALGGAREAVLIRAVAAKELALDQPEPVRWQEAFDRFLEADALETSSDIRYELGFIASQLRQDDLAVGYYEDAIELGVDGPPREKALAFITQYGPRMARLDVHGERGMRLQTRGIERGTLPLARPIVVFAGESRLEVIDPKQRQSSSLLLSLEAGQIKRIDLAPAPKVVTTLAAAVTPRPVRSAMSAPPSGAAQSRKLSAGPWLLGAGAGLLVTNAVLVPISYWKLSSKRNQLANACDTPSGSPDGCEITKHGRYEEGTALADDIADWKTVRSIAWTGLGIGAGSAVSGILLMRTNANPPRQLRNLIVVPTTDHRSLLLKWYGTF